MLVFTQANPVYKGYIRWNRSHNETKTIKKKEEWIIKKGNHPAILSEELFDRAQERYQRESHPKQERASATYQHWLSGVVKCSACGRTLTYNRVYKKGKNYSYFQCYGYSKKLCSISHAISEQKIVSALFCSLYEAACTDTTFILEEKKKEVEKEKKMQEDSKYLIQMQLERLEKKEERVYAAYIDGVDTLEEYKKKKQLLSKERKNLEEQLSLVSITEQQNVRDIEINAISDLITAIKSDYFTNIEKNKAIRTIIEKIVYEKLNGTILIYYYLENKK